MPRAMLGRLFRIYQRYAMRHLRLETVRQLRLAHPGEAGETRIDRMYLDDNRLVVEGWSTADRVGVALGRERVFCTPSLHAPGEDARGFAVRIPFMRAPVQALTDTAGQITAHPLPQVSALRLAGARLVLFGQFLAALAGALPDIWAWKMRGELGRREVLKERLGFVTPSQAVPLDPAVFEPSGLPAMRSPVTVILPVYNAFDLMVEALERVLTHTDLPFWLIIVEDGSTDPQVRPYLRKRCAEAQAAGQHVLLIEQPENTGFIGAVNAGLAQAMAADDPVVLLNSDAMVPAGWASRLLAPLLHDRSVATVTPFSNDGEIFSVPVLCQTSDLAPGQVDALDRAVQRVSAEAGRVDCPTGVGFCMAMSMAFLREVGGLDPAFGRGYGEETDWCQRARGAGGRHVCAADLFVEHRGAASFGAAEKQALLAKNHGIIQSRYPGYDLEVQRFLRDDPLGAPRLAHALALLNLQATGPVPLYLAHAMGGGAEFYLQRRIADDLAQGPGAIVLRVGTGHRWRLEVHGPQGTVQGESNDTDLIHRLLDAVDARRVVYSCGVGDMDPVQLPALLCQLARGPDCHLELLFHDYFPLSPSYVLLDEDGTFAGVPEVATRDAAHQITRPDGTHVSLAQWRAAWAGAVARADEMTVFSADSRRLVAEAYPDSAGKIVVTPHAVRAVPAIARPAPQVPVIGVLGNIGFHKGADVLRTLSRHLAQTGAARLVVVGNVDPAYALSHPALVHGSYTLDELPHIVGQYEIDRWFIPSIWPETFSFTTHEALMTGLPVYTFDLGAQADAVRAALENGGQGTVIDMQSLAAETLTRQLTSGQSLAAQGADS